MQMLNQSRPITFEHLPVVTFWFPSFLAFKRKSNFSRGSRLLCNVYRWCLRLWVNNHALCCSYFNDIFLLKIHSIYLFILIIHLFWCWGYCDLFYTWVHVNIISIKILLTYLILLMIHILKTVCMIQHFPYYHVKKG